MGIHRIGCLLLIGLCFNLTAEATECTKVAAGDNYHYERCRSSQDPEANIHFLQFTGTPKDSAFVQGQLLAPVITKGIAKYVRDKRTQLLASLPEGQQRLYEWLLECFMNNYKASVSREFIEMHEQLARGITSAGITGWTADELLESSLAPELGIMFDALKRKLDKNPLLTVAELIPQCALQIPISLIKDLLRQPALRASYTQFGCTSIGASGQASRTGDLILGRTLDSSALGYVEKDTTVILYQPPSGLAYVGLAPAGIPYSAGFTGMNDAGLVASIHELQTENYQNFHGFRRGNTGFHLQNLILAQATTIEEGKRILERSKNFGAWTIVLGDKKTNEIVTFEFTGKEWAIAQRITNAPLVQTNHFLASQLKKSFYNYSYGKVLESRFRMDVVKEAFGTASAGIDEQWIMNMLASHRDAEVGLRSFGRNVTKTHSTYAHIMNPVSSEVLTTFGDARPITHGQYLKFKVNFDAPIGGGYQFFETKSSSNSDYQDLPNWRLSLEPFTLAWQAYKNTEHTLENLKQMRALVRRALDLAELDGIFEQSYAYISARLEIKISAIENTFPNAALHWLGRILAESELHPWDRGLALLWTARLQALDPQSSSQTALTNFEKALTNYRRVLERESEQREHILKKIRSFYDSSADSFLESDLKEYAKEAIDFATIE